MSQDGGGEWPVFQCDTCTKKVQMFGETVEVALTFVVNEKGEPVDPADD